MKKYLYTIAITMLSFGAANGQNKTQVDMNMRGLKTEELRGNTEYGDVTFHMCSDGLWRPEVKQPAKASEPVAPRGSDKQYKETKQNLTSFEAGMNAYSARMDRERNMTRKEKRRARFAEYKQFYGMNRTGFDENTR